MSRPLRLSKPVWERAFEADTVFTHQYIKYKSHGYNRNSDGQILATRVDNGKQVWFELLTPKRPRTIRETPALLRGGY